MLKSGVEERWSVEGCRRRFPRIIPARGDASARPDDGARRGAHATAGGDAGRCERRDQRVNRGRHFRFRAGVMLGNFGFSATFVYVNVLEKRALSSRTNNKRTRLNMIDEVR